ncbi:MAG: hypothetical protein JO291_09795 [Acidimicrobiia bacterium]|nr:hypothetical protein [Acidimicrobiia bacterium]
MLIGAALLAGAALFVWLRGPDREQEFGVEDELDGVPSDEGVGDLDQAVVPLTV